MEEGIIYISHDNAENFHVECSWNGLSFGMRTKKLSLVTRAIEATSRSLFLLQMFGDKVAPFIRQKIHFNELASMVGGREVMLVTIQAAPQAEIRVKGKDAPDHNDMVTEHWTNESGEREDHYFTGDGKKTYLFGINPKMVSRATIRMETGGDKPTKTFIFDRDYATLKSDER